ncbi:hypothetical protein GCM10009849_18840 [Sinomonas flava]|uniref:Uncharacterized protein n=1 Tax=Sinomonas flava TaxID=496857 RepID=A0ABP5NPC8_9MICC
MPHERHAVEVAPFDVFDERVHGGAEPDAGWIVTGREARRGRGMHDVPRCLEPCPDGPPRPPPMPRAVHQDEGLSHARRVVPVQVR